MKLTKFERKNRHLRNLIDRAAWERWLTKLRARAWVQYGHLCRHGGSKAGERVAEAAHAADYYEREARKHRLYEHRQWRGVR